MTELPDRSTGKLERTYIYTVKWQSWRKRLRLGGALDAGEDFVAAINRVNEMTESATALGYLDWQSVIASAVEIFHEAGFERVD